MGKDHGELRLVQNPWTIIDELLAAQYVQIGGLIPRRGTHTGTPTFLEVLKPGVHPGSPRRSEKKSPWVISSRRGKKALWNLPEHFVPLNKACPEEKQFNQNLTCWNILDNSQSGGRMIMSILTCPRLEKKKYVTLGPSDHTAVNMGVAWATFVRFPGQKHRLTESKS